MLPEKAQRNPSVTLVASTNVGYWAPGTDCPFADKKVFRVVSFDPTRPKGKKTKLEELQVDELEAPLWFSVNQGNNAVVIGDDEVKEIKYNKTEERHLCEHGNVVSDVERKLKDGSVQVYQIPPMHPDVYTQLTGKKQKKKKKRPRAEPEEPSPAKKAKPLPLPEPISHIKDERIVRVSDWTGCHGLYSIADAVGAEGLQAMEDMFADKTDLDPHDVFDTWYNEYWMPALRRLDSLPFAKQCPMTIEPQWRILAMDCLKNGFVLVMHIYRLIVPDETRPAFVQTAMNNWELYRTLPITEWALTGPGLKNAETWNKGMKIATTPPQRGDSRPEYGSATLLGMFLAFAFHVTA